MRRGYAGGMKVGVPSEIKNNEFRVAITPAGVHDLSAHGHAVTVQSGAGLGSSISDDDYRAAGATIAATAAEVWNGAELLLKVKEPIESEYGYFRDDLVLFTYLHLAAEAELTAHLVSSGITAIAYETVQLPSRALPLLAPMSEVAGRLAPIVGANAMLRPNGGPGLLVPGVPGTHPAHVVVLGGGVAGTNAISVSVGLGARVTVLDTNIQRLRELDADYAGRIQTIASNSFEIEKAVLDADLVIGSVLVPGAKAPKLVTNALVARMKPGSVLVDIAIDQGGCFEDSHPTTHADPTYTRSRVAVLLRGEHAGRGRAHLDLRAHQRDAALRALDRQPRLGRGAAVRPGPRARPQRARRPGRQRGRRGRPGPAGGHRRGRDRLASAELEQCPARDPGFDQPALARALAEQQAPHRALW